MRVKWMELQLAGIAWLSGIAIAIVASCAGTKPAPVTVAEPAPVAVPAPELPSPMEKFPW